MNWPTFFITPFDLPSRDYRWWKGANDKRRPTSGKDRSKIKAARKQSRKDRRK